MTVGEESDDKEIGVGQFLLLRMPLDLVGDGAGANFGSLSKSLL